MTGLLVRLHRTLRKRTIRENPSATIVAVLMYIYGFIGVLSLTGTVLFAAEDTRGVSLAGMAGIGTLAFVMAAMIIPSGENALRPATFAALPISSRDLMPALGWASVLNSRGILAILCSLATAVIGAVVIGGAAGLGWALAWLPAIIVAAFTTLLIAEVAVAMGAGGGRARKEYANILGTVLLVALIMGFNMVSNLGLGSIPLDRIGNVLSWTPFAAAPGAVASAMAGQWWAVSGQLLLATVTVVGGTWLWMSLVTRQMETPLDSLGGGVGSKKKKQRLDTEKIGIPVLLPVLRNSPAAMIYSRAVRYMRRDSRMLGTLITYPLLGLFFIGQGIFVEPFMLYFGVVMVALLGGVLGANDFGYDGPASWTHLATGVSIRILVLARHAASMTPMAVTLVVLGGLSFFVTDDPGVLALVLTVAVGMFLTSSALALILTTFNPYPTSRPGTNPWSDKSGYSGAAFLSAFAMMFLGWVPSLPGIALVSFGYQAGITGLLVLGIVLALGVPAVIYAAAGMISVRRVENRFPEIFNKVKSWVN